ncbi:hypothetical protein TVAG_293550 [Trichomonas vaginalis G3]|uniref:Uncharacterized protein n=1 Tax=Trichomonas vaginalis (strain ATCC PRA-98 / G3) TaxID=412133 RepID=A2FCM8_TRIV3|nr:nuclear import signal receptor protein [Trichomonas vaginalis G3]EAX97350.1 hypothetical protein TVAG_293550 [Trichomonas vaginalis G3]KAI5533142.1 nuclear import signal receptor protein [Trichomonas vaginalis G3]|eukprot:XP_001310280.1 hypothetical protein [Trichomonas vaginalis G3]
MQRSESNNEIQQMVRDNSGGDLSDYKSQLQQERNSRTLILRQMNRPSIKNVAYSQPSRAKSRCSLNEDIQMVMEAAAAIFQSKDESRIQRYCMLLVNGDASNLSELKAIAKNKEVVSALSESFQQNFSEQTLSYLISITGLIFSFNNDNLSILIDDGFCYLLPDFLQNPNLINATLSLINRMADSIAYARDGLLCNEIHILLVNIAQEATEPEIVETCCETIYKMFANPADIEFDTLFNSVVPISPLLSLTNINAVNYILESYVEMACKSSTIVLSYNKIGLYENILNFLQVPELLASSLKVIRVLALGNPPNVWKLINNGLIPAVNQYIDTEYCPEIFWIFSNLMETLEHDIIHIFDANFISMVVEKCKIGTFPIKKEGSYFLATFALFIDRCDLIPFFSSDVIDILVEMLGCGVLLVVLRIVDSFVQLVTKLTDRDSNRDIITELIESDLSDRLSDIIEQPNSIVTNRATYLLEYLNYLENGETSPTLID